LQSLLARMFLGLRSLWNTLAEWMYFSPRSIWYRKNWWCSGVRSSFALMTCRTTQSSFQYQSQVLQGLHDGCHADACSWNLYTQKRVTTGACTLCCAGCTVPLINTAVLCSACPQYGSLALLGTTGH
jgi:hypothetical protein